jgi:hypothetical protein
MSTERDEVLVGSCLLRGVDVELARALERVDKDGSAFDLQHSVVVLKYWGRLGPVFDEQAKLLMHDLRDAHSCHALQMSTERDEVLVGSCLLRGVDVELARALAIVSTLPAEDHLRLHLDALKWVTSKLARYEEAKTQVGGRVESTYTLSALRPSRPKSR